MFPSSGVWLASKCLIQNRLSSNRHPVSKGHINTLRHK